jgi:hypothetical protein
MTSSVFPLSDDRKLDEFRLGEFKISNHKLPIRPIDHNYGHKLGLYTGVTLSLLGNLAIEGSRDLTIGTSPSLSPPPPTYVD